MLKNTVAFQGYKWINSVFPTKVINNDAGFKKRMIKFHTLGIESVNGDLWLFELA